MGILADKIEEIRKKPEHIRVRYVWGCVAASMLLIVTIWIFSITAMFKDDAPKAEGDNIGNLKEQLQNINQQAPSIKDIGSQMQGLKSEGVAGQSNQPNEGSELQYPLPSENQEVPQSAAYSTDN